MLYKKIIQNKLVVIRKGDNGIITDSSPVDDLTMLHPRLTKIFMSEVILTLNSLSSSEGKDYLTVICDTLDINRETLLRAISSYHPPTCRDNDQLQYVFSGAPSKYVFVHDFGIYPAISNSTIIFYDNYGTLDNDHWMSEIAAMTDNIKTIPSKYQQKKYESTIQYIGKCYGSDEKYIDHFECTTNYMNREGGYMDDRQEVDTI